MKSDSSRFVSSLSLRSRYAGEVNGMLIEMEGKTEGERGCLMETLIHAVRKACRDKDNNAHRASLWRATAMLIKTPGIHHFVQCLVAEYDKYKLKQGDSKVVVTNLQMECTIIWGKVDFMS